MEYQEILKINEYGIIRVKLKEIMDAHGITRSRLAQRIGVRYEVINRWYGGSLEKIDTDILARLIFFFNCEITDIVEYQAPEQR